MLARIWEVHKRFIIGIVVSLLFLVAAYQIAVAPLNRKAKTETVKSKDSERRLNKHFAPGVEEPTDGTYKRYRKASSTLMTQLDEMKQIVGFPVQAPFVLPAGESLPKAYYLDVASKTAREVLVAANTRAIQVVPKVLTSCQGAVDREKVDAALVSLAVYRQALLTAVMAGVASLESVTFNTGERSAPIENVRLVEDLISITVKGTPGSIHTWLKSLGRRDSFLMIASAQIKRLESVEEGEWVTAKVHLGPLTMEEVVVEEEEEDEG
ncbi:MAG: hypothetical protein ACYTHM_03745 [Planctomycetota bacterium]|jgi:hypothetical protein